MNHQQQMFKRLNNFPSFLVIFLQVGDRPTVFDEILLSSNKSTVKDTLQGRRAKPVRSEFLSTERKCVEATDLKLLP